MEDIKYQCSSISLLAHSVSLSLGQAFHRNEPETEPVRDVELHGMLGKRPLQVSSEFLSETLAGISVKPDGLKRYSYKSLVNPDLSKVSLT